MFDSIHPKTVYPVIRNQLFDPPVHFPHHLWRFSVNVDQRLSLILSNPALLYLGLIVVIPNPAMWVIIFWLVEDAITVVRLKVSVTGKAYVIHDDVYHEVHPPFVQGV